MHNNGVDNDTTLVNLGHQAVAAAHARADFITLSVAMDEQVQTIRGTLDVIGFTDNVIIAYSTKFASAFYVLFREAGGTALNGNRQAIK